MIDAEVGDLRRRHRRELRRRQGGEVGVVQTVQLAGGQGYVAGASDFLVFCADMKRPTEAAERTAGGAQDNALGRVGDLNVIGAGGGGSDPRVVVGVAC